MILSFYIIPGQVLTTAWAVFPETVTVQTHPKATFATHPMNIEHCCFTYITHLPDTTNSSFPSHFLYKNKKNTSNVYMHWLYVTYFKLGKSSEVSAQIIMQEVTVWERHKERPQDRQEGTMALQAEDPTPMPCISGS